ncbi:MAG: hypothetical protein AAB651_01730 [Patescibacteria group bacterium]
MKDKKNLRNADDDWIRREIRENTIMEAYFVPVFIVVCAIFTAAWLLWLKP